MASLQDQWDIVMKGDHVVTLTFHYKPRGGKCFKSLQFYKLKDTHEIKTSY